MLIPQGHHMRAHVSVTPNIGAKIQTWIFCLIFCRKTSTSHRDSRHAVHVLHPQHSCCYHHNSVGQPQVSCTSGWSASGDMGASSFRSVGPRASAAPFMACHTVNRILFRELLLLEVQNVSSHRIQQFSCWSIHPRHVLGTNTYLELVDNQRRLHCALSPEGQTS